MLRPRVSCFTLPDFDLWKRRLRAPAARAEWVLFRRLMQRMQMQSSEELVTRYVEIMAEFKYVETELYMDLFGGIEKNDPRRSDPEFAARLREYNLLGKELSTVQNELYIQHQYGSSSKLDDYRARLKRERENQAREQGTYREDTISERHRWNHIEEFCARLERDGPSEYAQKLREQAITRQAEDTREDLGQ